MDEQEYMRKMKANERLYMYGDMNEWTAWNGAKKGEWRPSGLVDVVLRGGNALMERAASKLYWKHSGLDGDIIYWRYAQEMDGDTFPIIVGENTITVGATISATVGEKLAEKPRSQRTRRTLSV